MGKQNTFSNTNALFLINISKFRTLMRKKKNAEEILLAKLGRKFNLQIL